MARTVNRSSVYHPLSAQGQIVDCRAKSHSRAPGWAGACGRVPPFPREVAPGKVPSLRCSRCSQAACKPLWAPVHSVLYQVDQASQPQAASGLGTGPPPGLTGGVTAFVTGSLCSFWWVREVYMCTCGHACTYVNRCVSFMCACVFSWVLKTSCRCHSDFKAN